MSVIMVVLPRDNFALGGFCSYCCNSWYSKKQGEVWSIRWNKGNNLNSTEFCINCAKKQDIVTFNHQFSLKSKLGYHLCRYLILFPQLYTSWNANTLKTLLDSSCMPVEFRAYDNNDLLRCITHPSICPCYCYLKVAPATLVNII